MQSELLCNTCSDGYTRVHLSNQLLSWGEAIWRFHDSRLPVSVVTLQMRIREPWLCCLVLSLSFSIFIMIRLFDSSYFWYITWFLLHAMISHTKLLDLCRSFYASSQCKKPFSFVNRKTAFFSPPLNFCSLVVIVYRIEIVIEHSIALLPPILIKQQITQYFISWVKF